MNKLLKTALKAAPRMMRTSRDPRKVALQKAAMWAVSRMRPEPKRGVSGRSAAMGLGAAALAIPVGLWVGRKLRSGE
ncbi:MAG TPA: hypothetical protein VHG28_06735 [Longimicrobiaceae bacterium]|nr:hypothetical protein [Longimicrobiaceae bacterium]